MVAGLITGLIVGAAAVFLVYHNLMRRKAKEAEESAAVLTGAARRATKEVSTLRLQVQEYEKGEQAGSDLIMLFPDLVKMIFSGRDSDEIVNFVNRSCNNLLKANESAVFLADRTGARLCLSASTGLSGILGKQVNLGLGDGFVGLAAETGRFLIRKDIEKESTLVRRKIESSEIPGFLPEFAAPMLVEGVLYGVITAGAFEGKGSMRSETLRALAAVAAAALENVRLLERFGKSSNLDPETGFLGKNSLEPAIENELERVERFGSPLAVIELKLKAAEEDKEASAREIVGVTAKHLFLSLRNIDVGIRMSRGTVIILLPGTDAEGIKSVTGKLGGEIPLLTLDDGSHVGATQIKSIVVEGGSRLDVRDLLDRLRAKEPMEFEGYYDA